MATGRRWHYLNAMNIMGDEILLIALIVLSVFAGKMP